jgi:defect in organelle trafficking protein DotB
MSTPFNPQRFTHPLTTRLGINEAFIFAAENGVSDIKLQPGQKPIAEVGGVQYPLSGQVLTTQQMKVIADELYGNNAAAGMVLSGSPVNGAYDIVHGNARLRFRYNATACYAPGEQSLWIAVRAIPSVPPTLEALDIEKEIVARLRPEKGIILVAGVTGSGKSTLLAAMLRKIAEQPGKTRSETIITIEWPIEFVYDGVKKDSTIIVQQELGRDIRHGQIAGEFTASLWGQAISNAMRQKPTIINPSELREQDAYRAAITAAATGHLCIASVHTESVSSTIFRIVNEFSPNEQHGVGIGLLANMQTVICQHLIPKKGGGRIAVREYLHFTSEIKRDLMQVEPAHWMPMLRNIMDGVSPEIGRKGITHVRQHYEAGLIDEIEMARWEAEAKVGGLG